MIRAGCLIAAVYLALLSGPPSSAQGLHHAGLVVRHGDGRIVYAYVAFPEVSISGVELLRRSGISLVTVGFGGLGEGVCTIDGEGCPSSDCRKRVCQGSGEDAPFWQYFRQRAPGDWVALALGASATKVRDGDVDGWSWTGHDPALPALTIADVARLAGVAATASPGAQEEIQPTAAVRTVYPPGMGPAKTDDGQGTMVYLAGVGALAVVGGATIVALRRRARPERVA